MLLGVDVGGTFTDAVLVGADSSVHTAKVPTTPAEQSLAVLEAVRLVLARAATGAQDSHAVGGHAGARWRIDDVGSELPVDGSTELVHGETSSDLFGLEHTHS